MENNQDLIDSVNATRSGLVITDTSRISTQIKEHADMEYFNICIEIAKWMSSLFNEEVSPDLCKSLADGVYLCRLLDEFIPEGKLASYHKNIKADAESVFASDNIHIFSTKCKELGIQTSYVLNKSHFEKGQVKEIVNCILLLAYLGKNKQMEVPLPALENTLYQRMMPAKSGAFREGTLIDSTTIPEEEERECGEEEECETVPEVKEEEKEAIVEELEKDAEKATNDNLQMIVALMATVSVIMMALFNY